VTNPAVREVTVSASLFATLNVFSHGRMQIGIGRGDSSRRVLGKKPTTLENLEEFVRVFRALNGGTSVELDGVSTRFPWANSGVPQVWVAAYGPKALRTAGRIGDGVILQFADPDLIEWCLGFVREGAREAGRDPSKIEVMAAAPVWASDDLKLARERVRWFPALVSNHVMDLISKYKPEELPKSLVSYVQNRGKYDYLHHCEVGSDNADFVSDEIVDRFCVVGPIEQHRKKLEALRKAGVTQFNIYLMCGDEEKTLELYGREVLPRYSNAVSKSTA
jgi:probable F420-dependent oxidoreductase